MKKDIEKLQGTWNVVSLEMGGQKLAAENLGEARIVVQGNRFTSVGMGATYKGTMDVDATKTPKAFDLKFTAGPEKGNTNLGIYELDGDTWRICLNTRGKDRPKRFAAKPGSGDALETLQRQKAGGLRRSAKHAASEQNSPLPSLGAVDPVVHRCTSRPGSLLTPRTQGLNAGKRQCGIYELDGRTLKLSFSAPGQDRPADFTTERGDGRTLTVWSLTKR